MGIKELILQKGWAGRTIDRGETVDRFNPIIRVMNELMQFYLAAAEASGDNARRAAITASLRTLQMDIGKMCETVFSCGGVAYNGIDLNPEDFRLGTALSGKILAQEAKLESALEDETNIEHQMRSRAILGVVTENQKERLRSLRGL